MTTGRKKPQGSTATGKWSVRLLGEPALIGPDGRERLLERRAAALLALAAVEPGIARRNVARMLWPDSDESNARQALRQQLLRIRKVTGRDVFEPGSALRLAAGVSSDGGERSSTEPFLGSFDYGEEDELAQWVARERERRRGTIVEELSSAADRAEAEGDFAAALAFAQRLVRADETNERHHRALMRLHYLDGDVAQARVDYQRLRDMLQREYAAEPSAETEQLARTLRSASITIAAPRAAPPPSLTRPPRLVGRDRAWQTLMGAWADGEGAVVSGVAGMGKSRLLAELAAQHTNIVSVSARPGDAYAPYSVLARVARVFVDRFGAAIRSGVRAELASLLPELGEARPLRGAADRGRMLRAIEAVVDVAVGHDVAGLVVDDAHYADAASLEALTALVAPGGLRIIVAFRADEIGPEARALADAILAPGTRSAIALQPLDEAQVAQLIDSLEVPGLAGARLAPRVARHTGGNPLFVLETLKAMLLDGDARAGTALPVAANVRDLIARRLSRLSERALALARCAAVAGQDFSAELASHVMGVRPIDLADAWAELERVHVFRDGAFDHDLIHEAARVSVPAAIARRLHAEIASFLESEGTEPARVAQHWVAAARPREGGAALMAAARRARDAGRRHEEGMLLAQAADCLAQAGDASGRFEALLARAEAMMCDDLGEATREAVASAARAAATDDQRLRALLGEAQHASNRGESQECVRVGTRGRELAHSLGRGDLAIHFAAIAAGGLCELRRVEEALALLLPYRGDAERLAPSLAAEYLIQLGIVLDLANRLREALEAFDAARRLAAAHGLKDLLATSISNLATTTSKHGELVRAVDYGRQALRLWREAEPLKGMPMQTQVLLAHRLRDMGRYDEAIPMFEEALAEFRRAGARAWIFAAAHRLALAYAHLGQHARALKLLADDAHDLPTKARAIWEAHRGEVARLAGTAGGDRTGTALALLGSEVDDGNNRLVSLFAAAIVPAPQGEAMAAAVAAWAVARERFGMAMAAHARAAACALAQGAADRALAQIEGALRLEDAYQPDNFYFPELWWIASQAFLAVGRQAEGDRFLERARGWIADTAARHVRAEFRESFLHRNPVNRAVMAAARRRLAAT